MTSLPPAVPIAVGEPSRGGIEATTAPRRDTSTAEEDDLLLLPSKPAAAPHSPVVAPTPSQPAKQPACGGDDIDEFEHILVAKRAAAATAAAARDEGTGAVVGSAASPLSSAAILTAKNSDVDLTDARRVESSTGEAAVPPPRRDEPVSIVVTGGNTSPATAVRSGAAAAAAEEGGYSSPQISVGPPPSSGPVAAAQHADPASPLSSSSSGPSPRMNRYARMLSGAGASLVPEGGGEPSLKIPPIMRGIALADLDIKRAVVKGQGSFAKVVATLFTPSQRWAEVCAQFPQLIAPTVPSGGAAAAARLQSPTRRAGSTVIASAGGSPHTPSLSSNNLAAPASPVSGLARTASIASSSNASFATMPSQLAAAQAAESATREQMMKPRQVAIKIMSKEAVNRSAFTSLQAEIDICATLYHPCIINCLGAIEDASSIYIVMDLAEGGEIFGYTRRFGLEDMPEVAPNFLAEVILGLEYMFARGIIHRDIKPENLLLTSDYHVKIADFGTAVRVDSEENRFTGTPAYVSPEVIFTGRASAKSDIWAVGCVLYQLFVGRPPFQGDSAYFIMENIKKRAFEFPPYFPPDAKDLVDKMMATDPQLRIGFADIKRHPFFKNVDWDTCVYKSNITFLNETHTNARWAQYLGPGENVVFASPIVKERYAAFSIKQRYLILTDYPRLFYVKEESNTIKGTVPWTDDICCQADNTTVFHVYTGTGMLDRTYHFVDAENHAQIWAARINDQVKLTKAKRAREQAKERSAAAMKAQAERAKASPKLGSTVPSSSRTTSTVSAPEDDEWVAVPSAKK